MYHVRVCMCSNVPCESVCLRECWRASSAILCHGILKGRAGKHSQRLLHSIFPQSNHRSPLPHRPLTVRQPQLPERLPFRYAGGQSVPLAQLTFQLSTTAPAPALLPSVLSLASNRTRLMPAVTPAEVQVGGWVGVAGVSQERRRASCLRRRR